MDNSTNPTDDISLDDLFPDGDYSSVLNDLQFSDTVEFNDNNRDDLLQLLASANSDDTNSETADGNDSSELVHFLLDEQRDAVAIVDDKERMPNSTFDQNSSITNMPMPQETTGDQNSSITNMPMPQETTGDQNVIMYQMYPSIFEMLDAAISVKQQPKANNRIRYGCDGVRFLPDSRYHPLAVTFCNLQRIALAKNQTLGIVTTIVTSTNNPTSQTFVHANNITVREPNAIQIAYGCVFAPLKQSEIDEGIKEYRRLSILYKKYNDYSFDLTPFSTETMFGTTQQYTVLNDPNMDIVPKGKCFKQHYDLLSYKLVFQLALKENNIIYISNITCETEVVHEQSVTQKPGKRTVSFSIESLSEEESNFETQVSNSSKKFKSSTPPLIGLPNLLFYFVGMNFNSYSTEDSDLALLDDLIESPSTNEDFSFRVAYDYNPLETFYEANSAATRNDEQITINSPHNESLPVIRSHTEKPSESSVTLSNCVAITNSKSKKIQLVYPLENTYRARYKSDYFPQNGTLPTDYQYDVENDYIRVALITTCIEGHGHYYSPYKFQKDHYDIKVPDENPIYIKIENSRDTNSVIRLQLVLIKSKLDQLNYVQPLIRFSDTTARIQNIIHEEKLTPKDLINKYQLEKSHLAFTLCTKLPDGLYKPHPKTTVISSVISEASASKKPNGKLLFVYIYIYVALDHKSE
ncbi:unnamed protein product [Rotaria sp. Silwood1]|nr:unnamed protein product [Rotaria sp. Silwood1]CAF3416978.1 unnamed protein product [Rotaria sp. Silwood1]CAF4514900.1 unnamed protein product [Rotaria sp. Silwood1]